VTIFEFQTLTGTPACSVSVQTTPSASTARPYFAASFTPIPFSPIRVLGTSTATLYPPTHSSISGSPSPTAAASNHPGQTCYGILQ
jgi:hypothetical protein